MQRLNRQTHFIPVSLKPASCKETDRMSVSLLEAFVRLKIQG